MPASRKRIFLIEYLIDIFIRIEYFKIVYLNDYGLKILCYYCNLLILINFFPISTREKTKCPPKISLDKSK